MRVRIDRAKQLLSDGGPPIGEVAEAVGYDDAGYFSRLFTRRVGVSPSRFRDQARR